MEERNGTQAASETSLSETELFDGAQVTEAELLEEINENSTESASGSSFLSSNRSNDPDKSSSCDDDKKYTSLVFSLSNARSLAKKIDSMIDMFREKGLSFAMITETWFKNDRYTNQELEDITSAEKIEFICKNRTSNKRGGGVAVAFDNTKASFKKLQIQGNKFELVGVVGKINNVSRKCVVFSLYIPPAQCAEKTQNLFRQWRRSCFSFWYI